MSVSWRRHGSPGRRVGRGRRSRGPEIQEKGVEGKFYTTGHGKLDRSNYFISNRLEMLLTTSNRELYMNVRRQVKHNGYQRYFFRHQKPISHPGCQMKSEKAMCRYVCMNAGAQGRVFALTASCLRGKLIPPILTHCFGWFNIVFFSWLNFLARFFAPCSSSPSSWQSKTHIELNPQQEIILTQAKIWTSARS